MGGHGVFITRRAASCCAVCWLSSPGRPIHSPQATCRVDPDTVHFTELFLFVHRKFKGPRKRPTKVPANKSQNPRKRPNFPATTSSKFSSITMSRGGSHSCQRRGATTRQPPFTALVLTSQTSFLLPLTHDKCIQPAVWRISCEQLLEMGESRSQRRHLPHKRSGDHVATA